MITRDDNAPTPTPTPTPAPSYSTNRPVTAAPQNRPTPTRAVPARPPVVIPPMSVPAHRPGRSVPQSIFDDLRQAMTGPGSIGSALGTGIEGVETGIGWLMGGVGRADQPLSSGIVGLNTAARTGSYTQAQQDDYKARAEAANPVPGGGAGLLAAPALTAMAASDTAWSYGVARPAATGLLLTDEESPLWKDGMSVEDVQKAWDKSETVSFGQAAAASPLTRLQPGANAVIAINDIGSYNPWSEYDMAQSADNPYYNFVTGSTDAALMFSVPPMAKAARMAAVKQMGLSSRVASQADIDLRRNHWEMHRAGTRTAWGMYVDAAAEMTNVSKIRTLPPVANARGIDKSEFADIIARTTDKDTINELFLANLGDVTALTRLADAAPDYVWAMSDMNSIIQDAAINGTLFRPTGESLKRVNQAFDSAVDRDRFFTDARRMFLTDNGGARQGSTWLPSTRISVEVARRAVGEAKYVVRTGDLPEAPTWVPTVLKRGNGPVTVMLQWVGSKQPLGVVSKSGARPNDVADEFDAFMNSIPKFRGNRPVAIGVKVENGAISNVLMGSVEFRNLWHRRLIEANRNGHLQQAWEEMENDVLAALARDMDISYETATEFARGYRQKAQEAVDYMNETGGYLFDEKGAKSLIDPVSRRQFLDSFQTIPLAEVYQQMRVDGHLLSTSVDKLASGATHAFDFGMKVFRTNLLFRPGYIPKNSIIEPLISTLLAHGTFLTDEGFLATLGNFARNRANNVKRVTYGMELDTLIKRVVSREPAQTRSAMRKKLTALVNARYDAIRVRDELLGELDDMTAGRVGPVAVAAYRDEVKGKLIEAQRMLNDIEDTLDGGAPEWRQVVEPASLADVRESLKEYRAMLGEDPEYAAVLERDVAAIIRQAQRRVTTPRQQAELDLAGLEIRLTQIDDRLKFLETERLPETSVARDGRTFGRTPIRDEATGNITGYADDVPGEVGDLARGRDYQAIALQRLRTKTVEDIDAAKAKAESMPADGDTPVSAFAFTANEASVLTRAEATLARINAGADESLRAKVDELQAIYDEALVAQKTPLESPLRKIEEAESLLTLIDQKIGATQRRLGASREKLAGVSGERAYHGSGQGYTTIRAGGDEFQIPSSMSDRAQDRGVGWRSEASSAHAQRLTGDPSYRASHEVSKYRRTGQLTVVDSTDVQYWDELAYVGNAYLRGDPLIQMILENKSRSQIAKWLASPPGRKYQKSMKRDYLTTRETTAPVLDADRPPIDGPSVARGPRADSDIAGSLPGTMNPQQRNVVSALDNTSSDVGSAPRAHRVVLESTSDLDETIRLVQQYFPDPEVRATIAARPVTPGELQRIMGGRPQSQRPGDGGLSRISGEDIIYDPTSKGLRGLADTTNRALDKIWEFIAAMPESRIARWPFFQREFKAQMEKRANIMSEQGVKFASPDDFNDMRQAALREAMDELEKTFYNIHRYGTPVYASRFLMSFPGAFFNSLYRYGRFAAKEPERLFKGTLIADAILSNGGVNDRGEKVDDVRDATYLLIPGTVQHGEDGKPMDYGLRYPVQSLLSVTVNAPAPSYATAVAVSMFVDKNPTNEDLLKKVMGEDTFEAIFPFGISRNPLSGMFGSYQKELWKLLRGPNDVDFMQTSVQIYADSLAQWEKGGQEGPRPTIEDATQATREYYTVSAAVKWADSFAQNRRAPGQLMRDKWQDAQRQFPGDPEAARNYFIQQNGDWAHWYTASSSDYSAYIPSTQKAYQRVFEDFPELTLDIVEMAGEADPEYVSLLALGTDGAFSQSVHNFYRENPLPGDEETIAQKMPLGLFDVKARVNEGWVTYSENKAKYDAEMVRLRELRDTSENEMMTDIYRAAMDGANKGWADYQSQLERANPDWAFARGEGAQDRAGRAILTFEMILSDDKFSSTVGKEPFWRGMREFMAMRNQTLETMGQIAANGVRNPETGEQILTADEARAAVRDGFVGYVQDTIIPNNPQFSPVWDRYFAREWGAE